MSSITEFKKLEIRSQIITIPLHSIRKREMKRISQYKKLFNVAGEINLKELKTTYRGMIKEWHPDKILDESKKAEAELKSLEIIDAYHFLVSIAPETKEAKLEEYNTTLKEAKIEDYRHNSMLFEVTFTDGNNYRYFVAN